MCGFASVLSVCGSRELVGKMSLGVIQPTTCGSFGVQSGLHAKGISVLAMGRGTGPYQEAYTDEGYETRCTPMSHCCQTACASC